DNNGKSDRKCFRSGDPNHLIREYPKPPKDKNQRAFVEGSWSDSGKEDDEKVKDETCLVAHASSEACSESSYFSDENSSIVDLALGYAQNSKPYIVLNKHTKKVEESLNVTFDEIPPPSKTSPLVDDNLDEEEAVKVVKKQNLENDIVDETLEIDKIVNIKESRNHPLENVIGNLNQITLRLVAQGYNQQEGIDYDETYAPVARLESIRILLAYACALDFKLFQMDVKSAFLNGFINEEMSMMGELNFFLGLEIKQMKDDIFFNQSKYIKEMLKKFVLEDSKPMKTLMSSDTRLIKDEECESVDNTKYRGIIGSLLFLTASRPDIMFSVCLCTRFQEAPKTSYFEAVKRIFRYIKGTTQLGLWYLKGTSIETVVYVDSDHAGDYVDRKSTSGICTFVGCCLTSWFLKKQIALAISTTEAEYVSAGKAGHGDHVSACLCHMLYCNESSTPYNLAFFILKRMEKTQNKPKELLPYGMLLSRLFKHVVFVFLELAIDNYPLFDHVLHPLAPSYERKTQANRGKKRPRESNASSSLSTLNHPPSSHPLDDSIDENDDESFYNTPKIQQHSGIPLGVLLHSPYAQVTKNDLKRDVLQNVTFDILKSEYTQVNS
nr:hypothetical protein [Tanacetum cinerariifolium]